MLTMIVHDNIYFPANTFTVVLDQAKEHFFKDQKEIAVFFQVPVGMGDIGIKCQVRGINDQDLQLEGVCRVRALQRLEEDMGDIMIGEMPDVYEKNLLNEGLIQGVKALVKLLFPNAAYLTKAKNPGNFADMVAANLELAHQEKIKLLYTPDSIARIKLIFGHLNKLNPKGQSGISAKANNPFVEDIKELEERIERTPLSDEARVVLNKEIAKLKYMHQYSPEYSVNRSFIEFILDMPWNSYTTDHLDIDKAKEILDHDHFDLKDAKERILEFLAVKKLNPTSKGSIICFCGPPGVGKTSLGKSIATAMGRKYIRMSLGGIRDEAEVRGHRRTYIGAMPGRIIKEIQRSKTMNPVFVLDEIDKLGKDFRGDPASALLEVLDPEQNFSFKDNYLEIPFDLSHVMFIGTANTTETIPPTLLDRMEVIEIPGYTDEEKFNIARLHLLPKKAHAVGLNPEDPVFEDEAIELLIAQYTMEAGVRDLERKLESLYRKVAKIKASDREVPGRIDCDVVRTFLGPATRYKEQALECDSVGMATGLAWTSAGGEILLIEATSMHGGGKLELTGNMGTIMQESARIALGFIKSHAPELYLDMIDFSKLDVHVHVPAGAISKDGPSAGLAMLAALVSHFQCRQVRNDTAITGEVTLTGRALPVGGIKEKILAAERAKLARVIVPLKNEPDVLKLAQDTPIQVEILYVKSFLDVLPMIFRDYQNRIPLSTP
ncbi:MAG: endopeptidase La [Syntrophaceae bacterium]